MSEVSRPVQVVLVLALAFAGLWFVALRPKSDTGGAPPPPATQPAKPAPHKSSLPGGLGRAVDKANATKRQGDGQAAASDRAGSAPETGPAAPAPTRPAPAPALSPAAAPTHASAPSSPAALLGGSVGASVARSQNAAVSAGAAAMGMVGATVLGSIGLPGPVARAGASAPARPASPLPARPARAKQGPGVTPGMVRHALADGDVVVLLFWGAGSDDRLVRSELSQVDRRGGRVHAWPVSVRGLARFKNVLSGIDVVQSPTVIVMAKGAHPRLFEGYTDHAEIDQATLLALTRA